MAEEEQDTAPKDSPKQGFNIKLIYLKDASFETPNSPGIFANNWENPTIEISLSHQNGQISDNTYEVVQTLTITAAVGDTTAYLAEVHQACIFTAVGIDPDDLHKLLNSYFLSFLYPYTSEAISGLVIKGGFPHAPLVPVNFRALYDQELKKMKENESAVAEAAT